MNRSTIYLGRIFGIPIRVDYSWFLIFALITWTSGCQLLPGRIQRLAGCPILDRRRGYCRSDVWVRAAARTGPFGGGLALQGSGA